MTQKRHVYRKAVLSILSLETKVTPLMNFLLALKLKSANECSLNVQFFGPLVLEVTVLCPQNLIVFCEELNFRLLQYNPCP